MDAITRTNGQTVNTIMDVFTKTTSQLAENLERRLDGQDAVLQEHKCRLERIGEESSTIAEHIAMLSKA